MPSSATVCWKPAIDGRFGGAPILLALVLVDHLDHALEREDAVEPRRRRLDPAGQALDGRKHRGEHRLVDPHDRRDALALDRERAVDRAARQHLRGGLRTGTSTASQPGGSRSRRSSPLALTDLSSQAQA